MDGNNLSRSGKDIFKDYLFLSREMHKFLSKDNFEMFEQLLGQRDSLLEALMNSADAWRPASAEVDEIASLEQYIRDKLQLLMNKGRNMQIANRAYQSYYNKSEGGNFEKNI